MKALDTVILGGALLVLGFAAAEVASRGVVWNCGGFTCAAEPCRTDTECERLAEYVDAHYAGRLHPEGYRP